MQSYFLLALLVFLNAGPIRALGEDGHGGDGSDYETFNGNNDYEFGSYGTAGGDPAADDPYYVPSEVRDLFEDSALRTQAEARARAEKEKQAGGLNWDGVIDGKTVVIEKKTVRRVSSPVTSVPVAANPGAATRGTTPSASATISQKVTPLVVVNNLVASNGAPPKEGDAKAPEKANDNDPRKVFKPLWLEAQPVGASKQTVFPISKTASAGWLDKLRTWWFDRPAQSAKSGATTRRLIVTAEEEIPSFDANSSVERNLSQEPHDLTSSGSWFGWIGWIVALMLLGLLLVKTKRELV